MRESKAHNNRIIQEELEKHLTDNDAYPGSGKMGGDDDPLEVWWEFRGLSIARHNEEAMSRWVHGRPKGGRGTSTRTICNSPDGI